MNDRELLEKAAKAYWGEEIDDVCSIRWLEDECGIGYTHGDNQDHNGIDREFLWNPLTEDGDALRLAVKLQFSVTVFDDAIGIGCKQRTDARYEEFPIEGNVNSATRRAIVRAAADIAND